MTPRRKGEIMEGYVDITCHGGEHKRVKGFIYGIVVVTPSFTEGWVITHIESGYAMTPSFSSVGKLKKLARLINSNKEHFERLSTTRKTKRNKDAGGLLHTFALQVGLERWW